MNNPFDSARALLSHASHHLLALSELLKKAVCDVTVLGPSLYPGGKKADIGLQIKRQPEMKEALIAFDVVSSLRAALDHVAYASATVLKKGKINSYKFPFGKTKADAYGRARKECADLHPDILKMIMGFEPWEDGNLYLYGLNQLRNTTIHRVLVPSGIILNTSRVDDRSCEEPIWLEDKSQLIFKNVDVIDNIDGTSTVASSHTWDVKLAIGADGLLFRKPPVKTFDDIGRIVHSILMGVERETKRLA